MTTLLKINSSIHSTAGQSSKLTEQFVNAWIAERPGAEVIVRDLAVNPVPHLDAARFGAFITRAEHRTPDQQVVVEYSDQLIGELQRADAMIIGLPMYNFGIPSTLKAYFDHIARAGVTFRYTEKGPVGLLTNKKAYVLATRGGYYAGTSRDTQSSYLRDFLNFIGINDVEFIYAEGLAISEQQKQRSLSQATDRIAELMPHRDALAA